MIPRPRMRARCRGATGSTSSPASGSSARASATCSSRRPRPPPAVLHGREELADLPIDARGLLEPRRLDARLVLIARHHERRHAQLAQLRLELEDGLALHEDPAVS